MLPLYEAYVFIMFYFVFQNLRSLLACISLAWALKNAALLGRHCVLSWEVDFSFTIMRMTLRCYINCYVYHETTKTSK